MSGSVYGGQQPVSGATLQLYAVGVLGDGSAATPLLPQPVLSDANGQFHMAANYICPTPATPVYITATGGSPAPGTPNPQIALMAALGTCGLLANFPFVNINEITTVAAVYALAPFMSSITAIGSGTGDAAALASAFTEAGYFANSATGGTPGANVPSNYTVPVARIITIADLLGACINSPGGVSGDGTVCGSFFALTLPPGGATPTDTVAALLNLANNPTLNTASLYALIPPISPFQPIETVVPPDLSVRLLANSLFVVAPSAVNFAPVPVNFSQPTQTVTVSNGTSAGVNITSSAIAGVNASDFAIVPQAGSDCPITVAPNTACSFQISFTPTAAGPRAAYLILGNTSANPSIAIALSGTGTADSAGPVTLSPASLTFTQLGVPQTLTLTNAGSTPLSINGIRISSTGYTQTNNCGSSLAASSSCLIDVSVPANTLGTSATLTVVDDAATGPQVAHLSFPSFVGAGFPAVVDFGHWAIGAMGEEFFEVQGSGVSGAFSFTITGANAGDFSFAQGSSVLATSCTYEYRGGYRCYLDIFYTPSAPGASTAYVNVLGFGRFTLTGTGDPAGVDFEIYGSGVPYPSTAPLTALNLGSTPIGRPLVSQVGIRNSGTVSPLSLNPPVLSGPNAAEFAVTTPACASGCSPSITFTPTVAGIRSATLTYTDTTSAVARAVTLTATATTPVPVLTASTNLNFSNVPIGTVSASQTITVNAYQNHPVQASLAPTFNGGAQPFVFTGPTFCASTPCTLSVAYAPTAATGGGGANVYVVATDTIGLSAGNIQAYGQVAPLAFVGYAPESLSFAAQAIGTVSAPQTVTFTNIGTTDLMLTFTVQAGGGSAILDYTLVNNCPATLAVNATCTVDVFFAPVAGGPTHTSLEIDGANVPQYVDLTGVAV